MIDLSKLSWTEFETLVEIALQRAGYTIVRRGELGARGPDFEIVSSNGDYVFVEVKHFAHPPTGTALIRDFADDLRRYQAQTPGAQGLLVFSSDVAARALEMIASYPGLDIWTGRNVLELVSDDVTLVGQFADLIRGRQRLMRQAQAVAPPGRNAAQILGEKLAAIPPGKDGWRAYERLCTSALTEIFSPDLGPPDLQNRSADGLDIMDAIFAIRATVAPWALVRQEYDTRFAVAEFKNYTDPIGQKEVEAIAQYLWPVAKRMFGLLVTRLPPSENALAQRRRQWIESGKMIVILTDEDLMEMAQIREADGQPFDLIDAQLEAFLRTLSP